MTSTYVVDKEIAIIREREKAGDAPLFVPVILAPTPEASLALIRDKNWRPAGDKTLWEYPPHERARKMMEAAEEIAREVTAKERNTPKVGDKVALELWLKGQSGLVAAVISNRAALRVLPFYRVDRSAGETIPNATIAIFRAIALARGVINYPAHVHELINKVQDAKLAIAGSFLDAEISIERPSDGSDFVPNVPLSGVLLVGGRDIVLIPVRQGMSYSGDARATADASGMFSVAAFAREAGLCCVVRCYRRGSRGRSSWQFNLSLAGCSQRR